MIWSIWSVQDIFGWILSVHSLVVYQWHFLISPTWSYLTFSKELTITLFLYNFHRILDQIGKLEILIIWWQVLVLGLCYGTFTFWVEMANLKILFELCLKINTWKAMSFTWYVLIMYYFFYLILFTPIRISSPQSSSISSVLY